MNSIERKARFNDFYNATYQSAMNHCLSITGDFINSEDLLAKVYYSVYKAILKDKNCAVNPEELLDKEVKKQICKYWKKHKKEQVLPLLQETSINWQNVNLQITEQKAERQMIVQDILEFVSAQPELLRRAFAMYFYLNKTQQEIAQELQLSAETVEEYINCILQRINDQILVEHE